MNSDLVICNMEPSVSLEMELTITKGRGYVPADENLPKDAPIGVIPIDAIYTPIKNVAYKVENTRVGQKTDYEKLTIDIRTDGTIHPEDALIQHEAVGPRLGWCCSRTRDTGYCEHADQQDEFNATSHWMLLQP